MMYLGYKAFLILLCAQSILALIPLGMISRSSESNYHGRRKFEEVAEKCGYSGETYDVITEDGYILEVFHIPGNKSRPVLIMPGLGDGGECFILREKTSIGIVLADNGYDVWLGNYRGNRNGRHHTTLDPDVDKEFWDYSFHEIAIYDLTAIIDFILDKTGQEHMSAIGYSEGTTFFYALGAAKPEYNDKIKIMISLGPICYFESAKGVFTILIPALPTVAPILKTLGIEEVGTTESGLTKIASLACQIPAIRDTFCSRFALSALFGYDPDQVEPDMASTVFEYLPAGTSLKNLVHGTQSGRTKQFTQYDYGPIGNLKAYNSMSPPAYDLNKLTMAISLIAGKNDFMAVPVDVKKLSKKIPNLVEYYELEPELFNHADFIVGRDTHKILYPHILDLLDEYE